MHPGHDGGFDITQTFTDVDRIWQSLVRCKHYISSYTQSGRWCHCKGQLLCGIQLSTIRLSVKRARTGNNLKLSNMGNSPWAFGWHLLSMMHMSCTLLMISCCSPDPQKMSKWSHLRPWALSSIINRCFNTPGWFFWFSHLQMVDKIWQSLAICKLGTASYPQKNPQLWQMMSLQQLLCGIQLSTIRLSVKRARTGNNLKLSNMGNSPWAFGWHLLSMMHMSCTLLMISCCSPDPLKMSKWSHLRPWALSSIINRCFNMPGWFFWFSHLQMVDKIWQSLAICKLDTASYPQKNPQLWQMMSLQQLLCGIQLSTIRLSVKRARTGNNLKLSNMGNSPWAFGWHLLSMMHMSCTLLMISSCSPDPQKMSKWSHLRPWALSSIINRCFNMPGWFFWFSHLQMVDKIWQSLAICKLDTASYPQKPSTVADDVIATAALWDSVVHYQTISQKSSHW